MAQMEITPDPVPVGEQFQVKGVGYLINVPITVAVDGEDVGTAWANPSPDGGAFAFMWAINEVGSYEVTAEQTAPPDYEGDEDLKGTDQLEVITGWAALDEGTVEPETASASKATKRAPARGESKSDKDD